MRTEFRIEDQMGVFVICGVDAEDEEVARSLYYSPVIDGFAKRFPLDTPHLEQIYRNFQRYGPEMVLQAAGKVPVLWENALQVVLDRLVGESFSWFLGGSAALAVRGIDVQPRDIDIIVSEAGAQRMGDLLLDYLVEPVFHSPGWLWNWFGRAFQHARIEWVGGVNPSADEPQVSDYGPAAERALEPVTWRGREILTPPLPLQLEVTRRRGLNQRADQIQAYLENHSR